MAARIRGQEVTVTIVANGQPLTTMNDVKSFEVSLEFDRQEESYLGETAPRFDELAKGFKGSMELHLENQDFIGFMQTILDRANRRNTNIKINIQATLAFPNGDRPKFFGNDCFFGALPLSFGGREQYGSLKLDFAGSSARLVKS
jgi:hypothetical protein